MRLELRGPAASLRLEGLAELEAEGPSGRFALLPRHVDFATALVPGLLRCVEEGGRERFLAVDGGLLVKEGPRLLLSTRAFVEAEPGRLGEAVRGRLEALEEEERKNRGGLARLEAELLRGLGSGGGGP